MELRLGLIGLGRAAANMIPALAAHPHVRIAAAADPNPEARARFEADFGGPTFLDAEALCASGLIDAIYTATPHQCHAGDVVTAAAHGKHAIVEKPMALSLEECRAMTDAVRRAGTVLVVGHTHAFDPPTTLMGELIHSGEFGPLRQIVNLVYGDFLYRPRRPEELDSSKGGGIMYNQVPHQIEIVRTLATAPLRSVRAVTGAWDPARRTEGALAAFLTFADGAVAQLTYSGYDHFDSNELHYWVGEGGEETTPHHGEARRALAGVDPERERQMRTNSGFAGRGAVKPKGPMHEQHFGFLLASCERADLRPAADGVTIYADGGMREVPLAGRGRIYPNKDAVIDELYDAIAGLRPAVHDGEWGTATMAATLALVASARDGREVELAELLAT